MGATFQGMINQSVDRNAFLIQMYGVLIVYPTMSICRDNFGVDNNWTVQFFPYESRTDAKHARKSGDSNIMFNIDT